MNIDVSVAVSEKSCCRQASARTGCAYGGGRTNRCRGRHCALVAQCSFPRLDISSDFHDCRDWVKKRPRTSIILAFWRSNTWWVRCRARDFINLKSLNDFLSASLFSWRLLYTFALFFLQSLISDTSLSLWSSAVCRRKSKNWNWERRRKKFRNKKYEYLTSWLTWTTQTDSTRFWLSSDGYAMSFCQATWVIDHGILFFQCWKKNWYSTYSGQIWCSFYLIWIFFFSMIAWTYSFHQKKNITHQFWIYQDSVIGESCSFFVKTIT